MNLKSLFSALTMLLSLTAIFLFSSGAAAEPKTVPYVDLNQYAGIWYQIAHVPLVFEGGTCACARQKLTPGEPGVIKVYNSCNDKNPQGKLKEISGEAYNDDAQSNSKFTVDFHLLFKGSYWVVGLDQEYRYAVVSDSWSYSLYILSKTPTLSPDLYNEAVNIARAQGLNVAKLETTVQAGCQYPQ